MKEGSRVSIDPPASSAATNQATTTVAEKSALGPVSLTHDDVQTIVNAFLSRSPRADSVDPEGMCRGRYCMLIANVMSALVWMRDHKALILDMPTVARALSYEVLCSMALAHSFPLGQNATDGFAEVLMEDMPAGLIKTLIGQVQMIPGFDQDAPFTGPKAAFAREWHGYVASHFISENMDETSGHWLDLPHKSLARELGYADALAGTKRETAVLHPQLGQAWWQRFSRVRGVSHD